MANKLPTDPYKGVRDFYPEDYFIQEYIFNAMKEIAERYGYVSYDASPLEPTELYEAKSGDELVNEQTYTFEDRGDRRVTLRPEMTPTVARMVARKKRELTFPLRWYSVANFFRYERPQRGRLREHWQLNVDVVGVPDESADIEIISVAHALLIAFGLTEDQFQIRINDRRLINDTFTQAGLSDKQSEQMRRLIDRKDKMPEEEFTKKAAEIAGGDFEFDPKVSPEIENLLGKLKNIGVNNAVFWPTLMRGLDYYNGTVFEVFDTNSENARSILGGGRYDNLTRAFGVKEDVPFVGFALGDVTMRDVLETYNLLPVYQSTTKLCVCYADADRKDEVDALVATLRKNEISVVTANAVKKVGDQISYADKLDVPYVLCVGSQELDNNTFTVKELESGKETTLKQDELVSFFNNNA